MCRHIYDWNIVNCDVKQPISPHLTEALLKDISVIRDILFPTTNEKTPQKTSILIFILGDKITDQNAYRLRLFH